MNEDWLIDGRKIPDEVMGYIRKIAVQAIRENGQSPEVAAKVLNFNRSCIYEWLKRYDEGGYEALESRRPPGAKPVITREMEGWLEETVLNSTPVQHGYDTNLWTRDILAQMLKKEFGVSVSGLSVSLHLRKRNLSYQKPCYRDVARDEQEVEHFVKDKFPRIHRLADIEPFDDLRTQTSTDNTDLLSKSRVDVHMSRHGSIKWGPISALKMRRALA